MLLACQTHLGTKNLDSNMAGYSWKRRGDGVHIINLGKTWAKLMLAARVIAAVENPKDVCAISARPYGQRAVLKFAKYVGATAIAGRFCPGTFTNQIQKVFMEPRVLVVTDPRIDHQAVREASYVNIPVVAFCNTDSPLRCVDVAVPCNNKAKNSVALMWWLLTREVLRMRGTVKRNEAWPVPVDLFIYRDPEEERAAERAAKGEQAAEDDLEQKEDDQAWGADHHQYTPAAESWGAEGGLTAGAPAAGGNWAAGWDQPKA